MPDTTYFIIITTICWIDVFSRLVQNYLLVIGYCQREKGLVIYAYCIMTNHVHLLCRARDGQILSDIVRDFKIFTSKKIIDNIVNHPESRGEWILDLFQKACAHLGRDQKYKVW